MKKKGVGFMLHKYIKPEIEVVDIESRNDILLATSGDYTNANLDEAEEADDCACFDTKSRNTWGDIW